MKPLHWDAVDEQGEPYRYDSPNLRWGFILEPGDEGYVPPVPLNPKTKTQLKPMKHQNYYPSNVPAQIIWLENFRNKISNHATVVGVSVAACAAAIADARWLIYLLGSWLPAERQWHKSLPEAMARAQNSSNDILMVLPVFVPPPLPPAEPANGLPAVVPVKEGALDRIFKLLAEIKADAGYNESIGTDLGAIGSVATGPDYATLAPVLKLSLMNGHVVAGWGWEGYSAWLESCELQVDRGQGWVPLAVDTTPNYTDTMELPTVLTKWHYRGIYNVDGARVGQWSAVVTIVVGG